MYLKNMVGLVCLRKERLRMNKTKMDNLVDEIFHKVKKIRDAGQSEYARDVDNVFANFERVASFAGDSREKVLLTYMIKHILVYNI